MSTFYGGEQLNQVIDISRTSAGTSSYTVPVGFYGILKYYYMEPRNAQSGTLKQFQRDAGGTSVTIDETTTKIMNSSTSGYIPSGDRIEMELNGASPGINGRFIIHLYKNP
jgi:hypothetical protein